MGGHSQLMVAMINIILLIHLSHGSSVSGAQALEHLQLEKVTKGISSLLDLDILLALKSLLEYSTLDP